MTNPTLYTLGYSGFTPESYAATLRTAKVDVLIDVRRKPVSRKKGFSKNGLAAFLKSQGIEYRHLPELGMPETLLEERREGMELGDYLGSFARYLETCDEMLDELLKSCQEKACCLMCLEKQPAECHRSVIAKELRARANGRLKIVHLAGDVSNPSAGFD
jgi:uncharacterized protein (DUF488 family)